MSTILMLDRSLVFGRETVRERPLGGAESAFTWLAEALAARGHRVHVRTLGAQPIDDGVLDWAPLASPTPSKVDMVVANRQGWLFRHAPAAKRRVLWLHNSAQRLRRVRERAAAAWYRPVLVTLSAFHHGTIPRSLWGATATTVPLAPAELFEGATERAAAPKPRALFTSNPVHGLEELLHIWAGHIRPAVPGAELHLFGGAQTYQIRKGRRASSTIGRALEAARGLGAAGVVVHDPAPRPVLRDHLAEARALLYPYPAEETYCLAAAEAQAMGVPAVLGEAGCLSERVIDGTTGFLTRSQAEFVDRSVRVLSDNTLWLNMHRECLVRQRSRSWDHVAAEFEALL